MASFIICSPARKGYLHQPQSNAAMTAEARDALLKGIARSRLWLDEILSGAANSFDEIAAREGLVERHIRFLMPLAFVAPQVIEAIADGAAPADLTVSRLARGLSQVGRSGPDGTRPLVYSPAHSIHATRLPVRRAAHAGLTATGAACRNRLRR